MYKVFKRSSVEELLQLKKHIYDYIVPIDLEEIRWEVLNNKELYQFYQDNYVDGNDLVYWENDDDYVPLGMHYLMFEEYNSKLKFFIGTIPNNVDKRTIVGCITYLDKCDIVVDKECVTSVETVEVNYFYQGLGLLNKMLNEFYREIDKEQHLIVTRESEKGSLCRVMEHIKNIFYQNGFTKDIQFEYEINDEYVKKLKKRI